VSFWQPAVFRKVCPAYREDIPCTLIVRGKALIVREKVLIVREKVLTVCEKALIVREKALTVREKALTVSKTTWCDCEAKMDAKRYKFHFFDKMKMRENTCEAACFVCIYGDSGGWNIKTGGKHNMFSSCFICK